jgi:type II secretory pathway component PulK
LIKGVTLEMYTGQGTGPKTAAPKGFGFSPFENNGYAFGLKDVFTPFSDGRININTADANVLQLIPGVDPATAQAIIKTRSGPDGVDGTSDDTPYRSAGDIQRAGVPPEVVQGAGQYCDVRSRTFQVVVTAHYLTSTRQYIGVIWRNSPQDIRIVDFHLLSD